MNALDIISREQWGARNATGTHRRMSRYDGFVIHHSSGPQPNDGAATVRAIQVLHQENSNFGFIDIGYNFLIDGSGQIFQGRPRLGDQLARGAHSPGVNSTRIGVCLLGCFHPPAANCDAAPSEEQIDSLVELCRHLIMRQRIVEPRLGGHRDHRQTACPGDVLFSRLDEVRDRIAEPFTMSLPRPMGP